MFFNLLPVSSSVTETLFWQYPDEEQKGAQQGQSTLELQLPGPLPTSTVSSPPHTFPFHETQVTVGVRVVRPAIPKNHQDQSCTSWSVKHYYYLRICYVINFSTFWSTAVAYGWRIYLILFTIATIAPLRAVIFTISITTNNFSSIPSCSIFASWTYLGTCCNIDLHDSYQSHRTKEYWIFEKNDLHTHQILVYLLRDHRMRCCNMYSHMLPEKLYHSEELCGYHSVLNLVWKNSKIT